MAHQAGDQYSEDSGDAAGLISNGLSPLRPEAGDTDEKWLSIRWDGERRCVHAEWKGFANSTQFRTGSMALLKAIQERNATSTVNDTRKLEVVSHQDQLWIRDTWVPLAATSGLKRIAVVVALHGLARFAVEGIIRLVGATRLDARLFNSPDDAVKWVETEEKKSKTASR